MNEITELDLATIRLTKAQAKLRWLKGQRHPDTIKLAEVAHEFEAAADARAQLRQA